MVSISMLQSASQGINILLLNLFNPYQTIELSDTDKEYISDLLAFNKEIKDFMYGQITSGVSEDKMVQIDVCNA